MRQRRSVLRRKQLDEVRALEAEENALDHEHDEQHHAQQRAVSEPSRPGHKAPGPKVP